MRCRGPLLLQHLAVSITPWSLLRTVICLRGVRSEMDSLESVRCQETSSLLDMLMGPRRYMHWILRLQEVSRADFTIRSLSTASVIFGPVGPVTTVSTGTNTTLTSQCLSSCNQSMVMISGKWRAVHRTP